MRLRTVCTFKSAIPGAVKWAFLTLALPNPTAQKPPAKAASMPASASSKTTASLGGVCNPPANHTNKFGEELRHTGQRIIGRDGGQIIFIVDILAFHPSQRGRLINGAAFQHAVEAFAARDPAQLFIISTGEGDAFFI